MAEGPKITLGTVLKDKSALLITAMKWMLKNNNSIATRSLFQSIHPNVKVFGNRFEIQFIMNDYWDNVEHGQPPGTIVSEDKLVKWIAAKGIKPLSGRTASKIRRIGNKSIRRKYKALSTRLAAQQMAFHIARKIKRKGTKPRPFIEPVLDPWMQDLRNDIARILKRNYTIEIKDQMK